MSAPALEARDLYRFYHAGDEETLALRGVSLTAEAGQVVAVTGPSGSGKSTLLMCLAGLDEPDGGVVRIGGERLSRRPEAHRARVRGRSIGVLYQSANLLGHLTIDRNLALVQRIGGGSGGAARRAELLGQVGLAGRAHALPATLSGGELARASLAAAVVNDPPVLLADEPTGELDEASARRVLDVLRVRADAGTAVVVVTHDRDVATVADAEVRLRDGRMLA